MGHFGPKMAHPNNFGSALSILLHENFIVSREKRHLGQFYLFNLSAIFYCLIGHGRNWAKSLLLLDR